MLRQKFEEGTENSASVKNANVKWRLENEVSYFAYSAAAGVPPMTHGALQIALQNAETWGVLFCGNGSTLSPLVLHYLKMFHQKLCCYTEQKMFKYIFKSTFHVNTYYALCNTDTPTYNSASYTAYSNHIDPGSSKHCTSHVDLYNPAEPPCT